MNGKTYLFFILSIALLWSCEKEQAPPVIESIEPAFGSAETLVTIQGQNLGAIKQVTFSGQSVNFNTAYNSEVALLFRIPNNIPLGEHEVALITEGGTALTEFRITLEPPAVFSINPEFASPGDVVTVIGKNFYEPISVYFFDSIQTEIVTLFPDSMEIIVPEGIQKGRVTVDANGGVAISPVDFFSILQILVNDFDGNGMRNETNKWGFVGQVDQNAQTAIQSSNPEPIDGNFLKLTGTDALDITWIGGTQSHFGFPGDDFTTFGIKTGINNTLLEMDVNNNGKDNTFLSLILLEHDGETSDFVHEVRLKKSGWQRLSIPLNRFSNFEGRIVDPTKIKLIKVHLTDKDNSDQPLEANVDNIRFVEIL